MALGMGTEVLLCVYLAYFLPIGCALGTRPIHLVHWFAPIPFAVFVMIYDECLKSIMRATSPECIDKVTGQVTRNAGWMEKNMYW